MQKGKKVAVVGSGVAGLSTAYLLSREHTVTIFEREAAVGMDAHSLDAHGARMDIPLRVFSESYYPNLCSIYKHLGVKYRHADYSFSCRPAAAAASYFRYINFFVADMALPLPLCLNVRELFKCVRLAFQFAHFVNRAPAKLAAEAGELRLGTFLERHGYSKEFATCLLYPMLSVVCTCSYASVEAYPASIVVDYFANKYGLSGAQCRAYEGTRDVVDRITQPVERVITSATITRVDAAQPFAGGRERALVTWRGADGRELSEEFDEVVLAMQANASLRVLKTRELSQIEALASFSYESKRVVLHTDASLMPHNERDWSPLNIVAAPGADAASVTVWMNRIDADLRRELKGPIFQTWNPDVEPSKGSVLADYSFERPVVTPASEAGMAQLATSQGVGHIWFVGAYARYSMPLLENGVKSAMEVSRRLGVDTSDVEVDELALERAALSSATRRQRTWGMLLLAAAVGATALHSRRYLF